ARSTAGGIACQSAGPDALARSCRASLPGPGFELSGQKIIGDGQFSDLGVQVPDGALVDLGCLLATAFENILRSFEQRLFPLVNHGRMNAISCRQLGRSLLALQGLQ